MKSEFDSVPWYVSLFRFKRHKKCFRTISVQWAIIVTVTFATWEFNTRSLALWGKFKENMLLIHLLKALSFQWLWAMVIVLLLVRTWRVNLIAFLDTFPSSDLRDIRNVSERFQYSGPLNYCYICYVRVQYRLISMQPKELQMIHDGGKKIVVFNSGKTKKNLKMQFIQACRQSEKNKNFVYGYAYVWAEIQDLVQLS